MMVIIIKIITPIKLFIKKTQIQEINHLTNLKNHTNLLKVSHTNFYTFNKRCFMKKCFSFLAVLLFAGSSIFAQDNSQQDMMQAWQAYMTPGPMHAMLAKAVGEWKTDITMWMDPSQPPLMLKVLLSVKLFLEADISNINLQVRL